MSIASVATLRLKSPRNRPVGPPKARGGYTVEGRTAQLRVAAPAVAAAYDANPLLFVAGQLLPHEQACMPAQFFKDPAWSGEKNLMGAVLRDAVQVYRFEKSVHNGGNRHRKHAGRYRTRLSHEAEEWFKSNDISWPFSFLNVCEHLGLDAGQVRAMVFSRE